MLRISRIHHLAALVCTLLLLATSATAQSAKSIMDATAKKLDAMPAVKANFEIGTFKGTTPQSATITGSILAQRSMLFLKAPEMLIWYDGTTQWTLPRNSSEVNVSSPTKEEMSLLNPYTFINCYKKGFKLSASSTDFQGTPAHEIRMLPQSKKGFEGVYEIRVTIDKRSHLPLSVRLCDKNGIWTRIRISQLQEQPAKDTSHFRFKPTDFPEIEVIDLR